MDNYTREELQDVYLTDEGLLSLCDMLAAVPQVDWPQNEEDLEWLFWSFGAEKISSKD